MRKPRDIVHVFWLRDLSGEWLLRTDTSKRDLQREWTEARQLGYSVTSIEQYKTTRRRR